MNQIHRRITIASFSSSLLIALPGCERALEVVDQLNTDPPGSSSSGLPDEAVTPPVQNASCACASSPSLTALSCGGGEVPQTSSDVVQTTADGSVVLFNRCVDFADCEVMYWRGGNPTSLGAGFVVGLDGSGERVLLKASDTLSLVTVGGDTTRLPISTYYARGSLNAAGDIAFGLGLPSELDPIPDNGERLTRVSASGQVDKVGDLPGHILFFAVNPTGTQLVGSFYDNEELADVHLSGFRWSERGGLRFDFPGVPEGASLWPEALSADGSVVAGRSGPAHFIWSEAGGYTEIASTSGRSETFISNDGKVVIGSLIPDDLPADSAVFRWTAESGAVNLTPGRTSLAVDISDDAGVIVANSYEDAQIDGATPEDTFVWDTEHGTRTLDDVLAQRGVDTSGWDFGTPRVLSGDGKVLLGRATCGGVPTLYRVVLSD